MTASNKRDDIDPALRRPGRLDKEVEVGVPSSQGRVDVSTHVLRFSFYLWIFCLSKTEVSLCILPVRSQDDRRE